MIASLQQAERLEVHVKQTVILIAICLIPVPLRPQEHSPTIRTRANSQASTEVTLGERLAREYEKQPGLGSTPELDGISRYINSVGSKVASVLPSGRQYHFVFHPNPDFKSAFALPGRIHHRRRRFAGYCADGRRISQRISPRNRARGTWPRE